MATGHRPVGVAIVGCGEVTHQKHLRVLKAVPEARVVGLADADVDRARWVAKQHGIRDAYASVEDLLERRDVEAIGVCVPPDQHARVGVVAIGAGKHVYMEKPLARTSEDAEAIMQAAAQQHCVHLMGFHMRWHRLVRRLKATLHEGRVGEIESVRVLWFSPRTDESLPPWRLQRGTAGGAIYEIGAHCFDLWRHLGNSEIESVQALARSGSRDDEAAVLNGWLSNGALASAVLSERTAHAIEIEVCGTKGRIRADCQRFDGLEFLPLGSAPGRAAVRLRAAGNSLRELPRALIVQRGRNDYLDSYRGAWVHFCRAVRGLERPECSLYEGRQALAAAVAAIASAESGCLQPVAAPR